MSRETVEVVRRALEAWNTGGWSSPEEEFHSEVELGGPDVPEVFSGHDGLRRFRDDILSVWDYFHITPERFIERGDDVVVLARGRGRGRGSGIEFDQPIAYVFTLQEGTIARLLIFQDPKKALEAVGLRE
jgi:ketosteroid isomerase-like protein